MNVKKISKFLNDTHELT